MGVSVRTLSQDECGYNVRYKGEVRKAYSGNAGADFEDSVDSNKIFHDSLERGSRYKLDEQACFSRRGFITFEIPVINQYLAGDDLKLMQIIIGNERLPKTLVKGIIRGTCVYDTVEGVVLNISSGDGKGVVYDRNRHMFGPVYLRSLIQDLDVEEEIKGVLEDVLRDKFDEMDGRLEIRRGNVGKYWLIDDFYLEPGRWKDALPPDLFEKRFKPIRLGLVAPLNSRITLLLALLHQGKEALLNQIMQHLPVMPIGFRPVDATAKVNPYTAVYASIVRANNTLGDILRYNASMLEGIQFAYEAVVRHVRELMVDNQEHRMRGDNKYKPLAELLTGKTGLIRERMLGVRCDYSGRTVIVVDPEMSVDTVGIPKTMIGKLEELDVLRKMPCKAISKMGMLRSRKSKKLEEEACKMMEGEYEPIGRQPTLFYLGLRAFKVKPVDGSAIVLNPLSTTAFNADFDGDQMHTEAVLGDGAKYEVKRLMASTNNLFYSRNGDCHIEPRQEILHGLWLATSMKPNEKSKKYRIPESEAAYEDVYNKVCTQVYNIYDVIDTGQSEVSTAGQIAFRYALGYSTYGQYRVGTWPLVRGHIGETPVKKDWCTKVFGAVAVEDKGLFIRIVNRVVRLGFAVVNIFPPDMSMIGFGDVSGLTQEFDRKIREREEYYNLGFETESSFTAYYNSMYDELEKEVDKTLGDMLDVSCGYYALSKSGARGSRDNIRQLFGIKGRVKKNDHEAFNAVLKNPLSVQLNGLEHAITAYGSRRGLVEKTIETYEPGYLYRQMSHTSSTQVIRGEDCGDMEGFVLDYNMLEQFVPRARELSLPSAQNRLVRSYALKIMLGRYVVGRDKIIKTEEDARQVYNEQVAEVVKTGGVEQLIKKQGLRLRSPVTCKCGGCVKCYGVDLATNKMVVVGTPIGFLAAQSIGEPGTQLTMKNFQSGGIVGAANLTSAFDMLDKYMNLQSLKPTPSTMPISYDYIAPVDGFIRTVSMGNGSAKLCIEGSNEKDKVVNRLRQKVFVRDTVRLKQEVKKGESIQEVQGDLDMKELMEYRGVDYAQKYLALKLYDLFESNKTEVNFKHFETLVAGMTYYICMEGNESFRAGGQYMLTEYRTKDTTGCRFEKTLHGTKRGAMYREDTFSGMFMEQVREVTRRTVLRKGRDDLTDPLVRIAFGLGLGMGSDVPGYVENRGAIDVQ